MKVMVVKDKVQREKALGRLLKRRKVVAVVSDPSDLKRDIVKKADVVLLEHGEDSSRRG